MANPQKENGHLDIANELVEVMARTELSGGEFRFILAVLRKTWAWHKKSDWISLSQLEKITGLSRQMICKTKKKLVNCGLLSIVGKKLMFNKNYEHWLVNGKTLVNKKTLGSQLQGNKLVNYSLHTKETTKETNTKGLQLLKEKMRQLRKIK